MSESVEGGSRPIEPERLGAIGDPSKQEGPHDLFPGEDRFLSRSGRARIRKLWTSVGPVAERFMEPGEHVLYVVAEAIQGVSSLTFLGLGYLSARYHQVAVVVTDRRLIEVLLEPGGARPASRVRTVPWSATTAASVKMSRLVVVPAEGKKLRWNLSRSGDRKVLKVILPRIREGLEGAPAPAPTPVPRVHCFACGAALPPGEERCTACGGQVRSRGLAARLALAFPGAGLFYLGHPVLGAMDLIGEVLLFLLVALSLAVSPDLSEQWGTVGVAALFLAGTKLESLHVGEILAARRRPETPEERERWRRRMMAGSVVSVVAVSAALLSTGSLVESVDRDLDFAPLAEGWSWTRDPDQARAFAGDPGLRSQWFSPEGWIVTVFAYPLGLGESSDDVYTGLAEAEGLVPGSRRGLTGGRSGLLEGFAAEQILPDATGAPLRYISYFVEDPVGGDLHLILIVCVEEEVEEARAVIDGLLASAGWIDAAR